MGLFRSHTGRRPTSNPGTTPKTWTEILADYPNVRIRVTDAHVGIRVGHPGAAQTSNIDQFVFGTDVAVEASTSSRPACDGHAHLAVGLPDRGPDRHDHETPTSDPFPYKVFAIQVAGDSAPNGSQLLRDEASELLEGIFGGLLGSRD